MARGGAEFAVWVVIGLVVVVVSLIKKALAAAAQRAEQPEPEEGEYRASPDRVRQFLEQVMRGRARPAQPTAPPSAELARTPESVEVASPVFPVAAPAPQTEPTAPTRRRRPTGRKRAAAPRPPAAQPAEPVVPGGVRLADTDLKKAVIWSEILGRPVSVRPRIGHRPPTLRK